MKAVNAEKQENPENPREPESPLNPENKYTKQVVYLSCDPKSHIFYLRSGRVGVFCALRSSDYVVNIKRFRKIYIYI